MAGESQYGQNATKSGFHVGMYYPIGSTGKTRAIGEPKCGKYHMFGHNFLLSVAGEDLEYGDCLSASHTAYWTEVAAANGAEIAAGYLSTINAPAPGGWTTPLTDVLKEVLCGKLLYVDDADTAGIISEASKIAYFGPNDEVILETPITAASTNVRFSVYTTLPMPLIKAALDTHIIAVCQDRDGLSTNYEGQFPCGDEGNVVHVKAIGGSAGIAKWDPLIPAGDGKVQAVENAAPNGNLQDSYPCCYSYLYAVTTLAAQGDDMILAAWNSA